MKVDLGITNIGHTVRKFPKRKFEPKQLGRGPQDAMDSGACTTDFAALERLISKEANLNVKN